MSTNATRLLTTYNRPGRANRRWCGRKENALVPLFQGQYSADDESDAQSLAEGHSLAQEAPSCQANAHIAKRGNAVGYHQLMPGQREQPQGTEALRIT